MSLNLGLESVISKDTTVGLSDVLFAQLDFYDAYQAFVDYRNICEIVVKAKTSSENLDYAGKLLGVSIESIDISMEKFITTLKNAWDKFIGWFKQAISYIKYNVIKHTFKKDGEFEITLASREYFKNLLLSYEQIMKAIDSGSSWDDATTSNNNRMKYLADNDTGREKITTRSAMAEWLRLADKVIYEGNRLLKKCEKDKGDNAKVLATLLRPAMAACRKNLPLIINAVKKNKDPNMEEPDTSSISL